MPDPDRIKRFKDSPAERIKLLEEVSLKCYKEWDSWEASTSNPYGCHLAYLFVAIALVDDKWRYSMEMVPELEPDSTEVPFSAALTALFPPGHDVWLFIDREWNGLPESACPVCAHDCEGSYPTRDCYECGFTEAVDNIRTYKPTQKCDQ